jgi:hypothetical protein
VRAWGVARSAGQGTRTAPTNIAALLMLLNELGPFYPHSILCNELFGFHPKQKTISGNEDKPRLSYLRPKKDQGVPAFPSTVPLATSFGRSDARGD